MHSLWPLCPLSPHVNHAHLCTSSPIDSICTSYTLILTPMHPYVLLCPLFCPIVYPMPLCTTNEPYASSCVLLSPYAPPINSLFTLCPHLCTLCTPMHHYELAMLLSYTPHAPYASPMPTICPPVHSHEPIFTLCALLFTLFISHV